MKEKNYKTGRPENKYSYKNLAKLIKISDTSLFNLKKEDEELGNILILGIIAINEKDNKDFWNDMKILKEDVGGNKILERTTWSLPLTKKWKSVSYNYIIKGLSFYEEYGISYSDLMDYIYYTQTKKNLLELFYREIETKTNLSRKAFLK